MHNTPKSRLRYWAIAVVIAVVVLIVAGAFWLAPRLDSGVSAPAAPITAPPAATTPVAPTTTPPAPVALPPGGGERGCPWEPGSTTNPEYDPTDPYCNKRHNQYAYNRYYANNPAYICRDGRNAALGAAELDKFVPCLNGTLRLEVQYGRVTLYTTTHNGVKVYTGTTRSGIPNPSADRPWVIWQSGTIDNGNGPFFNIRYFNYPDLTFYNGYYRQGATGKWNLMINLGDERFSPNERYQVVLFWNDPNAPSGDDVPLPPGFNWSEVDKHKP